MKKFLGKIILYSLSSDLQIDWDEFFQDCKSNGVPYNLIPTPTKSKKEKNILEIKEVRRSIVKHIKNNCGVSIRSSGGAMFIPQENLYKWNPYEDTLLNFEGIEFVGVDVYDTEENKRVIVKALLEEVKSNFKEEIYKLTNKKVGGKNLKDLLGLFLVSSQDNKLKIDATTNMYNRLIEMYNKVKFYEGLTNVDLSYIKKVVAESIKEFKRIYDERNKQRYIDNW